MGGHHLILGRLTDYISGKTLDDTLDERHRQKIGRLLVEQKGYTQGQITPRSPVALEVDGKCASLLITYVVTVDEHTAMVIQYGPGSLVTRHRPALALGRLAAACQVPVVVVTNGEQADILDGATGRIVATGLDGIPDIGQLRGQMQKHHWRTISPQQVEMEARILMAYEVDDRCPCDDSVCTIDSGGSDKQT